MRHPPLSRRPRRRPAEPASFAQVVRAAPRAARPCFRRRHGRRPCRARCPALSPVSVLVVLPSSLPAQVDAAVGGKRPSPVAGQELGRRCEQPATALRDADCLATLPARERTEVCAPTLSYGLRFRTDVAVVQVRAVAVFLNFDGRGNTRAVPGRIHTKDEKRVNQDPPDSRAPLEPDRC
ncbi:hypothetical protein ACIA8P_36830 [Streptomyces cellulosae]|uniref:Uncharacterized protein n=1 Tax=Streptomyces cellulosae TaxID=1968 RepID=A0ABW7YDE2_STRCE